jgi:hypothetical protein
LVSSVEGSGGSTVDPIPLQSYQATLPTTPGAVRALHVQAQSANPGGVAVHSGGPTDTFDRSGNPLWNGTPGIPLAGDQSVDSVRGVSCAFMTNIWCKFKPHPDNPNSDINGLAYISDIRDFCLDRRNSTAQLTKTKWLLVCITSAVCNSLIDRTLTPDALYAFCETAIENLTLARTQELNDPGVYHRLPYPAFKYQERYPMINNSIVSMSIMTLASLTATQLAVFLMNHFIRPNFIPWDPEMPEEVIEKARFQALQEDGIYDSDDEKETGNTRTFHPAALFRTAHALKIKLDELYHGLPTPYLAWIIKKQHTGGIGGLCTEDARAVVRAVRPLRFEDELTERDKMFTLPPHRCVREVTGLLNMGHLFNLMCPGFLHMYFFGAWIMLIRPWIHMSMTRDDVDEFDAANMYYVPYCPERWATEVMTIKILIERLDNRSLTPIYRVFNNFDGFRFAHFFGANIDLRS